METEQLAPNGIGPLTKGLVYQRMATKWELPATLMKGTREMRKKAQTYLPQHPAESDKAYQNRLNRTVLRNYYKRTVSTLSGKVFAKGLVLEEDVPDNLREWCENIDLAKTHIEIFARTVFEDALAKGISYIYVDYPQIPNAESATKEQERQIGARPYAVHVKAENLLSFSSEIIGGVETLTEIRIYEEFIKQMDDFYQQPFQRVRIIRPNDWELWEAEQSKEWMKVAEGINTLGFISLIPIYTRRLGFMEGEPPLEDLAWMNLEHWQIRSDQRTALSTASFPILAATGWAEKQDGDLVFGPNVALTAQDPSAKFYYVESAGAHLAAGAAELADLEDQMRLFGLQFERGNKSGDVTATEKAIDTAEGVAPLHSWAMNFKDSLETMLMYMHAWIGQPMDKAGSIELNSEYGQNVQDQKELDILQKSRAGGDLTRVSYLNELQRRGVLPDDFDTQLEDEKLAESTVSLPAFPTNSKQGLDPSLQTNNQPSA